VGPGALFSLPERFGFLDKRLEELEGLRGLRVVVWVRGIWKSSSSSSEYRIFFDEKEGAWLPSGNIEEGKWKAFEFRSAVKSQYWFSAFDD
jgi:hypothetical protein